MTDHEFEKLVVEGIDTLPSWVHEKLVNVAFVIEDEPTAEQREEHNLHDGEVLFGLYEGVPLTDRSVEDFLMPDKITIFKNPILATYSRGEDIRICVHNTIWHEVAHYFGHDEDWVAKEEERRGKTL